MKNYKFHDHIKKYITHLETPNKRKNLVKQQLAVEKRFKKIWSQS